MQSLSQIFVTELRIQAPYMLVGVVSLGRGPYYYSNLVRKTLLAHPAIMATMEACKGRKLANPEPERCQVVRLSPWLDPVCRSIIRFGV